MVKPRWHGHANMSLWRTIQMVSAKGAICHNTMLIARKLSQSRKRQDWQEKLCLNNKSRRDKRINKMNEISTQKY